MIARASLICMLKDVIHAFLGCVASGCWTRLKNDHHGKGCLRGPQTFGSKDVLQLGFKNFRSCHRSMPLFGDEPEERASAPPARARRKAPPRLFGNEDEETLPSASSRASASSTASASVSANPAPVLFGDEPAERLRADLDPAGSSSSSIEEDGQALPPTLNLDWSVLHKFGELNFVSKAKEALQAPVRKRPYNNVNRALMAESTPKRRTGVFKDHGLDKMRVQKLMAEPCACSLSALKWSPVM